MLRLIVLIAATVAALLYVLSAYGTGAPSARPQVPAEQNVPEEKPVSDLLPELPAAPESNGADSAPPADLVQPEVQTPERVQDFPGPDLQPSPEYEDRPLDTPQTIAEAEGPVLYVSAASVNVRSGPSTNDRVIGALDAGAPVEALGPLATEWVQIRDMDGRIGYMSGQFLSEDAP